MNKPSSISTLHNDESDNEEPLILKASLTREIYRGNKLKSRIELNACREYPQKPEMNDYSISSSPEEERMFLNRSRLKRQNIDISNKHQGEQHNHSHYCINISFIIVIVSVLFGLYFLYQPPLPIDKVKNELYAKLLNQNSAITTIIDSLKDLIKGPSKKILTCLLGPTGVGKTFLINILQEQISPGSIEIYHSSDLTDLIDAEYYWKIKSYISKYLIVVLDDLQIDDLDRLTTLMEKIYSFEHLNILIIPVFNVQTEDCLKYLSNENSGSESSPKLTENSKFKNLLQKHRKLYRDYTQLIVFNHLNELVAQLWLKNAQEARNIRVSENVIRDLLNEQDIKCHGLKRLHSKMLLEI